MMDGGQKNTSPQGGHHNQTQKAKKQSELKPLERLTAISLAAFHVSLALWCSTMVLAGFVFWPDLDSDLDLAIFALAAVGGVSTLLNGAAARHQVLVLLRRKAIRSPDLIALACALITVYIAGRLFI